MMFLCFFFVFVYIFLGSVCIAVPQAQTQFFSQHSAAGFLWEGHIHLHRSETNQFINMRMDLM